MNTITDKLAEALRNALTRWQECGNLSETEETEIELGRNALAEYDAQRQVAAEPGTAAKAAEWLPVLTQGKYVRLHTALRPFNGSDNAASVAPTPAQPAATAPMREPRPIVIIHMNEDLIEDVTVSEPVDVLTINYLREIPEDRLVTQVDQGEGQQEQALVTLHSIEVDAAYTADRLTRYTETQGKEC